MNKFIKIITFLFLTIFFTNIVFSANTEDWFTQSSETMYTPEVNENDIVTATIWNSIVYDITNLITDVWWLKNYIDNNLNTFFKENWSFLEYNLKNVRFWKNLTVDWTITTSLLDIPEWWLPDNIIWSEEIKDYTIQTDDLSKDISFWVDVTFRKNWNNLYYNDWNVAIWTNIADEKLVIEWWNLAITGDWNGIIYNDWSKQTTAVTNTWEDILLTGDVAWILWNKNFKDWIKFKTLEWTDIINWFSTIMSSETVESSSTTHTYEWERLKFTPDSSISWVTKVTYPINLWSDFEKYNITFFTTYNWTIWFDGWLILWSNEFNLNSSKIWFVSPDNNVNVSYNNKFNSLRWDILVDNTWLVKIYKGWKFIIENQYDNTFNDSIDKIWFISPSQNDWQIIISNFKVTTYKLGEILINKISDDETLSWNSENTLVTERAIKIYVEDILWKEDWYCSETATSKWYWSEPSPDELCDTGNAINIRKYWDDWKLFWQCEWIKWWETVDCWSNVCQIELWPDVTEIQYKQQCDPVDTVLRAWDIWWKECFAKNGVAVSWNCRTWENNYFNQNWHKIWVSHGGQDCEWNGNTTHNGATSYRLENYHGWKGTCDIETGAFKWTTWSWDNFCSWSNWQMWTTVDCYKECEVTVPWEDINYCESGGQPLNDCAEWDTTCDIAPWLERKTIVIVDGARQWSNWLVSADCKWYSKPDSMWYKYYYEWEIWNGLYWIDDGNWGKTQIMCDTMEHNYEFTEFTFTNCWKWWRNGPTLSECTSAYAGQEFLDGFFDMPFDWYQRLVIPKDWKYKIKAAWAEWWYSENGWNRNGATMEAEFNLNKDDVIIITVWQEWQDRWWDYDAWWGWWTFVVLWWDRATATPLLIAWGGSGQSSDYGANPWSHTESTTWYNSRNDWNWGWSWAHPWGGWFFTSWTSIYSWQWFRQWLIGGQWNHSWWWFWWWAGWNDEYWTAGGWWSWGTGHDRSPWSWGWSSKSNGENTVWTTWSNAGNWYVTITFIE